MGRKIVRAVFSMFSVLPPTVAPERLRLLKTASRLEAHIKQMDISLYFLAVGNHMRRAMRKGIDNGKT